MFIQEAVNDPFFFTCVLITVVVSIVLHELAHGWAAIWQGDRTPIELGHMTPNPIVHMGWFSIVLFVVTGMAYGLMPVNPARFRSRYGDALVAVAGPVMNLLLAAAALTGVAYWIKIAGFWNDPAHTLPPLQANVQHFLWNFGIWNVALFILNLLPIPPLDGSRIIANFFPSFRRILNRFADPQVFMFALLGLLILFRALDFGFIDASRYVALDYVNLISGRELYFPKG